MTHTPAPTTRPQVDRRLSPSERVVHILDDIMSLNFPAVARIRGPLDPDRLSRAADELLVQHPLLGTSLTHGSSPRVRTLEGASVPIRVVEPARPAAWVEEAEREIATGWRSDEPRVRLVLLRHGPDDQTLMLTIHHPVSDGYSSLVALRDLLELAADPSRAPVPQAIAPLEDYLPAEARGWSGLVRSIRFWRAQLARDSLEPPHRVVANGAGGTIRIVPLELEEEPTALFLGRARTQGAMLHGALAAALLRGYARTLGLGTARLQCKHPIDMRPLLAPALGERRSALENGVGYFVSAVETAHTVDPSGGFWQLAREVSTHIMQSKHRGEHLDFLPVGNLTTAWLRRLVPRRTFARMVEKDLLKSSIAFSSGGELSILATQSVGPLEVEAVHFAAGPSIVAPLAVSSTTYRGRLRLNVTYRDPLFDRSQVERLVEAVETDLHAALRDLPRKPAAPRAPT